MRISVLLIVVTPQVPLTLSRALVLMFIYNTGKSDSECLRAFGSVIWKGECKDSPFFFSLRSGGKRKPLHPLRERERGREKERGREAELAEVQILYGPDRGCKAKQYYSVCVGVQAPVLWSVLAVRLTKHCELTVNTLCIEQMSLQFDRSCEHRCKSGLICTALAHVEWVHIYCMYAYFICIVSATDGHGA